MKILSRVIGAAVLVACLAPTIAWAQDAVPTIFALLPNEGPVGANVAIIGNGFSPDAADNVVTFDGTEAEVTFASPWILFVTVPDGATTGPLIVTVNGEESNEEEFTVTDPDENAPVIDSITPEEGVPGTPVLIQGTNLGFGFFGVGSPTVTFDGEEAPWAFGFVTAVWTVVPQGVEPGDVDVVVTVGDAASDPAVFTVLEPPEAPTLGVEDLGQFRFNQTAIDVGGTTTQFGAVFQGTLTSDAGGLVWLQVEVKPVGVAFNGFGLTFGAPVASGEVGSASALLFPGSYHWRARAVTAAGGGTAGEWMTFGDNAEADADLVVDPFP